VVGHGNEGSALASIAIIGDGPGGLSAALFLAKSGHEATVFGTDETAMHFAHLYNYLGIPEIGGTEFQRIAREQAMSFGAVIRNEEVIAVSADDGFTVTTESGSAAFDYLVLTEGKRPDLALSLGVAVEETGAIQVDRDYRSSLDGVYVVGRSARPERSQAIISAGAGATAALDILAIEAGTNVTDWDTPPQD
jgi:thioredoxin reductase (NADPH)